LCKTQILLVDPLICTVIETFDLESYPFEKFISCSSTQSTFALLYESALLKFKLRSWDERIDVLAEKSEWRQAIALGIQCYNMRKKLDNSQKLGVLSDRLLIILLRYIVSFFKQKSFTNEQVKELACYSFEVCTKIGGTEFLFSQVLELFQAADAENIFLESLETYLLNDRISYINRSLLNTYFGYFINTGRSNELDRSLLHLDLNRYDTEEFKSKLKEHRLFRTLIAHNLNHFSEESLLEFFLDEIDKAIEEEKSPESDLHMLLYTYLKLRLIGRSILHSKSLDNEKCYASQASLLVDLFIERTHITRTLLRYDPELFFSAIKSSFDSYPRKILKPIIQKPEQSQTEKTAQTNLKSSLGGDVFFGKMLEVTNAVTSVVGGIQSQVLKLQRSSANDRHDDNAPIVKLDSESKEPTIVIPEIQEMANLFMSYMKQDDLTVSFNK
jgi:hypothetical protein